ncbi:MAG: hypothetical protein BWZ08_02240 [candidate division BRC1 bacterium ADurb.BinA292]|nr:MAG: hypothetical protein BWZ08_02240 [candidate division BRC1 bacterium ADurb.BinA292]
MKIRIDNAPLLLATDYERRLLRVLIREAENGENGPGAFTALRRLVDFSTAGELAHVQLDLPSYENQRDTYVKLDRYARMLSDERPALQTWLQSVLQTIEMLAEFQGNGPALRRFMEIYSGLERGRYNDLLSPAALEAES